MKRLIVLGVLSGFLILLTKCGDNDSASRGGNDSASRGGNDSAPRGDNDSAPRGDNDSAPHSFQQNPSGEKNDIDSSAYFEIAILNDATAPFPYWNRAAWHLRNARIPEETVKKSAPLIPP